MRSYPFPGPSFDDVAHAMFGKDYNDLALPNSNFPSKLQNQVRDEWGKMRTDEQRRQREEASGDRAADRQKLERGIRMLPDARQNLGELRRQFQR